MKWIAIAGTWKDTNDDVERDVRKTVLEIITSGNGIVTGGALGVDYFATDEALKYDHTAEQIRIYLPSTLEKYGAHYRMRAEEGVITSVQAEALVQQLEKVKRLNPLAIVEDIESTGIDKVSYFNRITKIINLADGLAAFQVNESAGTQDTIDKAEKKGIPVQKLSYTITQK